MLHNVHKITVGDKIQLSCVLISVRLTQQIKDPAFFPLQERIVLQTVRWRMRVDIAVDPDMPLGSRASLVGRPYQEQPHILNYQEPIPPNALGRPNANDAQVLMWRPRRGAPLVVIPPK